MASTVIEVRDPVTAPQHHLQLEREEAQLPPPLPSLANIDGLPPLLPSLAIEGLPPRHHCVYMADAEKVGMDYISRWQIPSMKSYFLLALTFSGISHGVAIDVDRLMAMALMYLVLFVVDDLLIDSPNDILLGQYGIAASTRDSPEKIKEYFDVLTQIFAQKETRTQNPLEVIFSEAGRDMLRLSNPEWFSIFVASIDELFQACTDSQADIVSGESQCVQDLETYSVMREGNFGGTLMQVLQEFAADSYLPDEMRSLPFMLEARSHVSRQMSYINDLYSYHKESMLEANPRNVVTVLMESQGKTFVQSVHVTIELANMHAQHIIDLDMKTSDVTVRRHLQRLKDVMSGQLYYSAEDMRYRYPDSLFPELRDVNVSSSQTTTNLVCHPQAGAAPLPSTGLTLRAGH